MLFVENPNQLTWIRTIQIIATRLRHIVLTTLHQHLGLGEELINKHSKNLLDKGAFHYVIMVED
ncbi:hypothetical protein Mgra_00007782 [Meloidogyne graminicola]|uniref:Uncharacterized protein n=1 Tax=Meloidogyne graminicola TaxID=189291 RepID=A0A8S9ZHH4_9BILA|nr:hypothetical protein Mgra_00007782 [Meloidogyne graminicola]